MKHRVRGGIKEGISGAGDSQPEYKRVWGLHQKVGIYPKHSRKCCEIVRFVSGKESRKIAEDKLEE